MSIFKVPCSQTRCLLYAVMETHNAIVNFANGEIAQLPKKAFATNKEVIEIMEGIAALANRSFRKYGACFNEKRAKYPLDFLGEELSKFFHNDEHVLYDGVIEITELWFHSQVRFETGGALTPFNFTTDDMVVGAYGPKSFKGFADCYDFAITYHHSERHFVHQTFASVPWPHTFISDPVTYLQNLDYKWLKSYELGSLVLYAAETEKGTEVLHAGIYGCERVVMSKLGGGALSVLPLDTMPCCYGNRAYFFKPRWPSKVTKHFLNYIENEAFLKLTPLEIREKLLQRYGVILKSQCQYLFEKALYGRELEERIYSKFLSLVKPAHLFETPLSMLIHMGNCAVRAQKETPLNLRILETPF